MKADKTPDTLRAQISQLTNTHQAEVAKLNAKILALESDKTPDTLRKEINQLTKTHELKIVELDRNIASLEITIKNLNIKLNEQTEVISRLRKDLSVSEIKIKECDKNKHDCDEKLNEIKKELDAKIKELGILKQKDTGHGNLETEIASLQKKYNDQIVIHDLKIKEIQKESKDAQHAKDEIIAKLKLELEKNNHEHSTNNSTLLSQITQLKSDIKVLEQKTTNENELNNLRAELAKELAAGNKFMIERNKFKVELDEANSKLRSLQSQLTDTKNLEAKEHREIKDCDKHEEENKKLISNLHDQIAILEKQLKKVEYQNKPTTTSRFPQVETNYGKQRFGKDINYGKQKGGSLTAHNIVLLIAQISMATVKVNYYNHFDYMIHKNNMVYRIPKSDELLLRFVTAFYFNHLGYPFTTDLNALIQFLSTEAYTLLPFEYAKVYISAIQFTPADIQFFKDWDKRVDQLLDAQININNLNTSLNPKNVFSPFMRVSTSIFNKLPIATQRSLQQLRTMNPSDPINSYNKLNIGMNSKIQIAGKNSALYPKIIINGGSSPFAIIHNDQNPIILLQMEVDKLKDQYEKLTNINLDKIKPQLNEYKDKIKNNIIDIEKLMKNIKNDIDNDTFDEKKNTELNEYILRLNHRVNKLSKIIHTFMDKNNKLINKKSGSLHNALKN